MHIAAPSGTMQPLVVPALSFSGCLFGVEHLCAMAPFSRCPSFGVTACSPFSPYSLACAQAFPTPGKPANQPPREGVENPAPGKLRNSFSPPVLQSYPRRTRPVPKLPKPCHTRVLKRCVNSTNTRRCLPTLGQNLAELDQQLPDVAKYIPSLANFNEFDQTFGQHWPTFALPILAHVAPGEVAGNFGACSECLSADRHGRKE